VYDRLFIWPLLLVGSMCQCTVSANRPIYSARTQQLVLQGRTAEERTWGLIVCGVATRLERLTLILVIVIRMCLCCGAHAGVPRNEIGTCKKRCTLYHDSWDARSRITERGETRSEFKLWNTVDPLLLLYLHLMLVPWWYTIHIFSHILILLFLYSCQTRFFSSIFYINRCHGTAMILVLPCLLCFIAFHCHCRHLGCTCLRQRKEKHAQIVALNLGKLLRRIPY